MKKLTGAIAVPTLLLAAGCAGSSADEEPGQRDDSVKAGIMCEKFIERRVDRSDIEHGDWQEATATGKGNGPYVVKSRFSIDGPWINYTCKIKHTPNSDEWHLLDLNVAR